MARGALVRGESEEALGALDRHARTYRHAVLGEERDALFIQAFVGAGRYDEARARAKAFRRATPQSVLLPAVESVVPGNIGAGFLWVDDTYVYHQNDQSDLLGEIDRAPKNGSGPSTPIVEPGGDAGDADQEEIGAATVLGNTLYWIDVFFDSTGQQDTSILVKSMPLEGGPVAVFLGGSETPLEYFLRNAAPTDGGIVATTVDAGGTAAGVLCSQLLSDVDAVYCSSFSPSSVLRVSSDGTTTNLGTQIVGQNGAGLGFDDTYVYWVDSVTVGTIMRAPKTGGTATIFARDTSPLALGRRERGLLERPWRQRHEARQVKR